MRANWHFTRRIGQPSTFIDRMQRAMTHNENVHDDIARLSTFPRMMWYVRTMPDPLAPGASVEVGPHIIQREGPITRVIMTGQITVEHTQRFLAEYQAMIEEQGFVLIMMDMREGGEMAMPARRLASEWGSKRGHCVRSAVFGAPFFIRNAIELLNRAAKLMTGNAPKITFVRTYEEARDWLLVQIPHLPTKGASGEAERKSKP